jgi:hypothetical protein
MTEKFIKYNLDEIEYLKCINCDFYTKYLWSINRHIKNNNCEEKENNIISCEYCKKEFKFLSEKEKHLNKKKKCYITCENIIDKNIKNIDNNNINKLNKKIEELTKMNESLNEQIIKKDDTIKLLEDQKKEIRIFTYNHFSNALLERENLKNEKKNMLLYDLEYHILFNAITQYRDNNDDEQKLKDKLFLTMSFMKPERYNDFFRSVYKDYNYLIPFIIDYYKYLKTIDDKKINGKNRDSFIDDLSTKIKVYLNMEDLEI